MRKTFLAAAVAAASLAAAPAIAQQAGGAAGAPTAQTAPTAGATEGAYPSARLQQGHMMADDIIGARVIGAGDENVGDVSDLIVDPRSRRVEGAVLSVGGFLGIGAKSVAVPMDALTFDTDGRARISMTREQLEQAPSFDPDGNAQGATGATDTGTAGTGLGATTTPGGQPAGTTGGGAVRGN